MNRLHVMVRTALLAGSVAALLTTGVVHADPCERGDDESPQCRAPEVPATAVYPVLGAVSFAVAEALRTRRRRNAL